MALRFMHAGVKMQAAEEAFEAAGRTFRAGTFLVPAAGREALAPTLTRLGLSAVALPSMPSVKTHDLDVPRIGYVHSWQRTQDEGWVRAALDAHKVPYTYFADIRLRDGKLRERFDVIVYPHVGGSAQAQVNGIPKTDGPPLPYRRTPTTPHLGGLDEADDIRGGMGLDGLSALIEFVQDGGTLIVEGATAGILPEYGIARGVTVERPAQLFARGSIMRGVVVDRKSPLAYGFDAQVPVYFNQEPVLAVGAAPVGFGGGSAAVAGVGQNTTPMANSPVRLSPWEADPAAAATPPERPQADEAAAFRQTAQQRGLAVEETRPRVVLAFPRNPDEMLLSGTLAGGQALAGRAQVVDAAIGRGHVVMFAIRPFWRWQTQGTFFLGFNAILHWNDLDAGKAVGRSEGTASQP
jgi:hypothetical protein